MAEALTGLTDAAKNSAINSSVPRPARLKGKHGPESVSGMFFKAYFCLQQIKRHISAANPANVHGKALPLWRHGYRAIPPDLGLRTDLSVIGRYGTRGSINLMALLKQQNKAEV